MGSTTLHTVINHLRRVVGRDEGLTDAQLLQQFVSRCDEAAFEVLVWRHGSMVLSVCHTLLHDPQDAEDAFQATFLVLVRKAASISKRASLGSWLYQVAYRVALRARTKAARRPPHQPLDENLLAGTSAAEGDWQDLRPVLDEEINRLPEKYRVPVVLCYLQGHTNEEAAESLGCPKGTILSRLSRARDRLRTRLIRRGLVLSPAGLVALLCPEAMSAPPLPLVSSAVQAAMLIAAGNGTGALSPQVATLTEGVLHTMFMTRLKIATLGFLLAGLLAAGTGWLGQRVLADRPAAPEARQPAPERGRDGRQVAPEVRGVLKAVDAQKGTITLTTSQGREPPTDKTFSVAKDAEVLLSSGGERGRGGNVQEGKLGELIAGDLVTLMLSADQKTAEAIVAEGPTVQGTVKTVDAVKNSVTLVTAIRGGRERGEEPTIEEKTYSVSKNAEIVFDDGRGRRTSFKEGKLADLPTGALVVLKLSADQKAVESLLASGPIVRGRVKTVDAGKNTITVTSPAGRGGEGGEEKTYTVAPDIGVLVDIGRGRFPLRSRKLADVPAGAQVTIKLAVDQQTVGGIQAEGPTVQGTVKEVDAGKNTITVTVGATRTEAGEDKTFQVARNATIHINGAEGKLADVKGGENTPVFLKLSLDQKMAQSITAGSGRR